MVDKAPIVKEYKRAGSVFGVRGTRVLRLLTTVLSIGAGFYCLLYVPFDESHGDNIFTPIRRYYFKKRNEFYGVKTEPDDPKEVFRKENWFVSYKQERLYFPQRKEACTRSSFLHNYKGQRKS